jgi:serine/threonine-protein kinase
MMQGADEQAGRLILGRYRLVMPLAKGGQGVVYLARGEGAAGFTLPVVIKRVLTPIAKDPEANESFVREARITAQLRHPDIVSILDFERESDDSYVMVLEYVHGYDLAKWRTFVREDGRRFDAQLAAYITVRVLDALHYSHSMRGPGGEPTPIIHRDISPGNVLIDDEGHVKITDFGIAHSKVHQTDEPSSTTRVELKGKLAFLSPELYRGALPTAQSDLYACAVMLHQLLVGENEFQARDLMSAALRVATHVPTRVSSVRDDVSDVAAGVIAKALAKEPADRHVTARELSTDLRRAFQLDLGEMPERLMQAVRHDFFDPRFAQLTKTVELASIERALRDLPARVSLSQLASGPHASSMPTVEAPLSLRAAGRAAAKAPQSKLGTWLLLGVAVLAVAFSIAFFANRQPGEDRVVFVDAHKQAQAVAPPAGERVSEPSPAPRPSSANQAAPDAAKPEPAGSEPPKKAEGTRALTRAFASRRREVEACFTQHSAGLEGAPRIYVEFEIAPDGSVSAAHLDPDAIEGSELGRCLVQAAKATRFEPQLGELRFRIPLTARSQ